MLLGRIISGEEMKKVVELLAQIDEYAQACANSMSIGTPYPTNMRAELESDLLKLAGESNAKRLRSNRKSTRSREKVI